MILPAVYLYKAALEKLFPVGPVITGNNPATLLAFGSENTEIPAFSSFRFFFLAMTTDLAGDRCVTFSKIPCDFLGFTPRNKKIFDLAAVLLGEMSHFAPPC